MNVLKKSLAVLLSVAMVFTLMPTVPVFAATSVALGGASASYTTSSSSGTLASGKGTEAGIGIDSATGKVHAVTVSGGTVTKGEEITGGKISIAASGAKDFLIEDSSYKDVTNSTGISGEIIGTSGSENVEITLSSGLKAGDYSVYANSTANVSWSESGEKASPFVFTVFPLDDLAVSGTYNSETTAKLTGQSGTVYTDGEKLYADNTATPTEITGGVITFSATTSDTTTKVQAFWSVDGGTTGIKLPETNNTKEFAITIDPAKVEAGTYKIIAEGTGNGAFVLEIEDINAGSLKKVAFETIEKTGSTSGPIDVSEGADNAGIVIDKEYVYTAKAYANGSGTANALATKGAAADITIQCYDVNGNKVALADDPKSGDYDIIHQFTTLSSGQLV